MARSGKSQVVVIGVGSHAVAINTATGDEIWRTKLKSAHYVTVYQEGQRVLAGAGGEIFCLDLRTGELLWHNKLKGLGLGLVAFAGSTEAVASAMLAAQTATTVATM